jgi:hypothetical protein
MFDQSSSAVHLEARMWRHHYSEPEWSNATLSEIPIAGSVEFAYQPQK